MSVAIADLPGSSARVPVAQVFDPESGERLLVSRLAAVPEVELIDVRDSKRIWRVFHESYDLCLVPHAGNDPSGVAHWWYGGRMYEARPGGVILTEPGELHAVRRMERPARHYWILQIDPGMFSDAASEIDAAAPPHIRVPMSYSQPLFAALSKFYRAVMEGGSLLEQQSRFAECFRLILTEASERGPSSFAPPAVGVARAREYLHAHFSELVPLQRLATVAGMSRFHLAHAFRKAYGLPPHAYQNQLRLASARKQLLQGIPPSLIDAGFADQAHLTRHFKRAFGITPGNYARLNARASRYGYGRLRAAQA